MSAFSEGPPLPAQSGTFDNLRPKLVALALRIAGAFRRVAMAGVAFALVGAAIAKPPSVPSSPADIAGALLPDGFLNARGSQLLGPDGTPVRIASVGLTGMNVVGGRLQLAGPFKGIDGHVAAMRAMGFNCVRVDWIDKTLDDPEAMAQLDTFVAASKKVGLKVVFDNHNNEATPADWENAAQQKNGLWFDTGPGTDGTDGAGNKGTVTAAKFQEDWVSFARHWAGNSTVIGFDLRNEPCAHTRTPALWGGNGPTDIHAMYEAVGNAVLAVNPDALIICEGVINYKTGAYEGDLSVARSLPIRLNNPAKLVYSVHEYPKEIGGYGGAESGGGYVERMNRMWGWLVAENAAPVWIGEMGASMASTASKAWGQTLLDYMNGERPGAPTFSGGRQPIGGDWWAWGCLTGQNPNGCVGEDGKARPEQAPFINRMLFHPVDQYRLHPLPASLEKVRGIHPRLYLDTARIAELRQAIQTTHAPMWKAVRERADRAVKQGPPAYRERDNYSGDEQLWQREVGNAMPVLAMAWVLSGERQYLDAARQWALASCGYPTWGLGPIDGMDLAAGHQLFGLALVYDWCYADLGEDARRAIRDTLIKRTSAMFDAAKTGKAWWRRSYLQNHLWVNICGMAAAGLTLFDEVDGPSSWIGLPLDKFRRTMAALGPDGASHEGMGYWEYGAEYMLKFMDLARARLDVDLYTNQWWRNTARYAQYLTLPRRAWTRDDCVVDLADCPRGHWYGPDYILRALAREFHDGHAQWLAREIDDADVASPEAPWLNLLWFDPTVPAAPPSSLPTLRHFDDLGIVSARSDWSGDESLLVFRCGPFLGHKAAQEFSYDAGGGHVHPDANHFVLFGAGEWLIRDDGYRAKWTGQHNTLLVDGRGQLGEGSQWFDGAKPLAVKARPKIVRVSSSADLDQMTGDATEAYPSDLGLRRHLRHLLFLKPDMLLVCDEVVTDKPRRLELRFHPESRRAEHDGAAFVMRGSKSLLRLEPLPTEADVTVSAEDLAVEGREGERNQSMFTLRLSKQAAVWRNAVALTWSKSGNIPRTVRASTEGDEWTFSVGGRVVTLNWTTGLAEVSASEMPAASSPLEPPYPRSPVIGGIEWHWDTYATAAPGSDLWPTTWGPDDHLYTAWGDGGGFRGSDTDGRVAMGFARIEGGPDHWRGVNINGGKDPEHPASFPRKGKTSGVAFVDGVLYATVNLQNGTWPDVDHVLAWSTNNGATWTRADWLFPRGEGNFQPGVFLNFGKDYTGVPDSLAGYVYIVGPKHSTGLKGGNRLYLARAPRARLREGAAYEFFHGLDAAAKPAWVAQSAEAKPIFTDPNGVAPGSIVYDPGLKRFLLTCFHVGPGQLGLFDAPSPWGPWTTIAYYEDWGRMGVEGEGLTCGFPQKWMSADGLTLWSTFSAYGDGAKKGINAHDRFNLVKATLQPLAQPPSRR